MSKNAPDGEIGLPAERIQPAVDFLNQLIAVVGKVVVNTGADHLFR